MERRSKGKGKLKEEIGQRNRQVLGDIGNLEVFRVVDGKHISRPMTRSFHAKLLANGQTSANVIIPGLDSKAIVHREHRFEELTQKPNAELDSEAVERASRERSCRNVKTLTSEITAQSKAASEILIEPEEQVVDIDSNDPNELAVAVYLDDIYKFFKETEEEDDFRVSDYMKKHDINEMMRSITVDWVVDVHTRFKLMPETLFLTVNIIDRHLSSKTVPKEELQLVGISSMLIACKYEEIYPPQMNDFISISDKAYNKNQILSTEKAILKNLEWCLTVPTPYVFIVRFIRASGQADQLMENMVFFLAELGLVHYQAAIYCPSKTAAAAVYAARCTLNRRPFWTQILKLKAGYCTEQLRDCAKFLISLHAGASTTNLKAVYNKFCSIERKGVAFLSPPKDIEKHLI